MIHLSPETLGLLRVAIDTNDRIQEALAQARVQLDQRTVENLWAQAQKLGDELEAPALTHFWTLVRGEVEELDRARSRTT